MTKLSVFQSMWAMESQPYGGAEPWSMAERVAHVAEAGFDGVGIDTYTPGKNPPPQVMAPLLDDAGLRRSVTVFVTDDRPLQTGLEYPIELGAELVVICGQVFPESLAETVDVVGRWMAQCEAAGLPMHLETHRYTLTNDLIRTVQLVKELPGLLLALDLSHYVVANELPDAAADGTEAPHLQELLDALFARGGSVQGRVATREQIQVPLGWAPHAAAERRFDRWCIAAFREWLGRNPTGDCVFLCELGPYPYAIVGPDGKELSDRWQESQELADRARRLFSEARKDN